MKLEQYDKLSDKEIRIKVAELDGWKNVRHEATERDYDYGFKGIDPEGDSEDNFADVPDYLNDLNACHEFEKGMDNDTYLTYQAILAHRVESMPHDGLIRRLVSATARQRCKSYILTMTQDET